MPDEQQFVPRKRPRLAAPLSLYFCISAISGFSGAIYESNWTHYLKIFLGHVAYAQSLVIFLKSFTRPSNQIKFQRQL